jgi:hypothetical protein
LSASIFFASARVSSRGHADQPSPVVGDRFEGEFQLILHQAQLAHTSVVLPLFEVGQHPLDEPTFAASAAVAFVFLGGVGLR